MLNLNAIHNNHRFKKKLLGILGMFRWKFLGKISGNGNTGFLRISLPTFKYLLLTQVFFNLKNCTCGIFHNHENKSRTNQYSSLVYNFLLSTGNQHPIIIFFQFVFHYSRDVPMSPKTTCRYYRIFSTKV